MTVGPLGMQSMAEYTTQKYETRVASGRPDNAKAVLAESKERIRHILPVGGIVPQSAGETYTQKGFVPGVPERIGQIIDISV